MEEIEQNQEAMREDINLLNGKLDRLMDILQELANREQNPHPPVVESVIPEPQPTSAAVVGWPPFGLPPGYTPPQLEDPTESGPSQPRPAQASVPRPNGTHVMRENVDITPGFPIPQGTIENPLLVYHSSNPSGPHREHTEPSLDGRPPVVVKNEESKGKILALEERVEGMEGNNEFGFDALDMCLVSNVVIPPKFKIPDFKKYKGLTCPRNHLIMYCRKMGVASQDDKLLIHFFQDSLSGASLNWYMHLEKTQIRTWRDFVEVFVKQYKYNMGMAPDRMQLQDLTKRGTETFKEYAQRWRELASQVEPPLSERELVRIFISTLQAPYYEKVIGSASSSFSELVIIGEMGEVDLKNGKILNAQSGQGATRKFSTSFPKKKEGENNVVMADPRNSYYPPANAYHSSILQVPYQDQYYVATAAPVQYQQ